MSFWTKLFGGTKANQTPQTSASTTLDFRSDKERQVEAAARIGKVSPNVFQAVDELLRIQRQGFFLAYDPNKFECPCSEVNLLGPSYYAILRNGYYVCEHCGRISNREDFNERGKNKKVVQIGTDLYAKGGMDEMKSAAYRFKASGGHVSNLSIVWNGVCGWLD
jgi:hypothetical protein